MIIQTLALMLLAQGTPARTASPRQATPPVAVVPQVAAKGSISGVALHNSSGSPLPHVRVTVARTDIPENYSKIVRELIGSPEGGVRGEVTVPVEFIELMKDQITAEIASMKAMREARESGQTPRGLPPGLTLDDLPPGVSPADLFGGDFPSDFDMPPEMAAIADLDLNGLLSLSIDSSGKLSMIPKSAPPLMTDGSGRFQFEGLEPGTYRLTFAANGYVRQDYGQTAPGGGTPLLLEPGAKLDNLVARMNPTGTVTGRVVNSLGKPLAGVTLQLSRFAYDASGKKKALPALTAQTNDQGEYRFYFVTPGRYLVSAGAAGPVAGGYEGYDGIAAYASLYGYAMGLPGGMPTQNRVTDRRFIPAYYPGTPDVNTASAVDVPPGGAVHDVNFNLAAQGSFIVRGRIVDPRGGAPQTASVRLAPQDGAIVQMRGGPNYNPAEGTFEMRDVPSGAYVLIVEMQNPLALTPRQSGPRTQEQQQEIQNAQAQGRLRATIPIVVDNADVDGVVVSPAVGGFLNGRLRIEGAIAGRPPLQFNRLLSEFRPIGADGTPTMRPGLQPQPQAPRPDGSFRVNSVYAGDYWFRIRSMPEGYYVRSARIGDADVLNHPIALPLSDDNAILDVVVSPNVGQIDGVAVLADGRPAAGAKVVLIPDHHRERVELFRPVTADARGVFAIPNIEPGEYHIAVWPSMEPFAFFDPTYIAQAMENGRAVKVGESSKQKLNVEAFPPGDLP